MITSNNYHQISVDWLTPQHTVYIHSSKHNKYMRWSAFVEEFLSDMYGDIGSRLQKMLDASDDAIQLFAVIGNEHIPIEV